MNSLQTIPFKKTDGSEVTLADFSGKVLLIVNVASKCGLTPQYEGLEKLYETYKERGFEIIGFPANNFMGQEPGSNEEIQEFCKLSYGVSFPIMQKISVKDEDQHPLYKTLTEAFPERTTPEKSTFMQKLRDGLLGPKNPHDILWNFEKFLLGRDGKVIARFSPDIPPENPLIVSAIDAALQQS